MMNRKIYSLFIFILTFILSVPETGYSQKMPTSGNRHEVNAEIILLSPSGGNKKSTGEKSSYNYFRIDKSGRSLWNGKHWNPADYPLKVFVKVNRSGYFKQIYRDYIDYAMSIWEKADDRIKFKYVSTSRDADIIIVFEENLIMKYDDNYLGITDYELDDRKKIEKSVIEIGLLKFNNEPVSEGEVKSTIIHEMGHALGLGHSSSEADIMFPFIDPFSSSDMEFNELSIGDIEAVRSVVSLGFTISFNRRMN